MSLVLTENRLLDSTAVHIRKVSAPPRALVDLGHDFGWNDGHPAGWPGTMRIGVARFGANAHADSRAIQW